MNRLCSLLLWLGLALALPAAARPPTRPAPELAIEGVVVTVVDGDSLWLKPADGSAPVEVRLLGIDAPELCQDWGIESRQYLHDEVIRQPVRLVVPRGAAGHDDYGRTLGTLWLGEVNINVRMVEEGQAWSARFRGQRGPYLKQETMARALRRGLHQAGPAAVYPRDFRQSHGPCRTPPPPVAAKPLPPSAGSFRCDGRSQCSQMKSCVEATFFLRNCPGVNLEVGADGVPCAPALCKR